MLKEFEGGLRLESEAFGMPMLVATPSTPSGSTFVAAFDAGAARDLRGRLVLPQIHAALEFWDRRLSEAESEFNAA